MSKERLDGRRFRCECCPQCCHVALVSQDILRELPETSKFRYLSLPNLPTAD